MGFTCGLVGLPNIGKTTIFNALTNSKIESSNYAFSSSQPNIGIVAVPDKRLDVIDKLIKADKTVHTTMEFVDIAGLVEGSSRGEGLGNKFLANIREVDTIAHVVRCFDDDNIPHVHNKIDPASDIEELNTELMIADLETLERRKTKTQKLAKSGDKQAKFEMDMIDKLITTLDGNTFTRFLPLETEAEKKFVKSLSLLTSKPVLYVCNIADPSESDSDYVSQVKQHAQKESSPVAVLASKLENEILDIEDLDERQALMKEMGLEERGLDTMIREGYTLLDLVTFFTVGDQENRAWTMRKNLKAPQAAGKIHSDLEKGFIRAEVYHYDDLVLHKTENAIKEAGLLRVEGKDYIVKDGDILHIRFNV